FLNEPRNGISCDSFTILLDEFRFPTVDLFQRIQHHGNKDEITVFTNLITQCTFLVVVLVVDEPCEIFTFQSVDPIFFYRLSVVKCWSIVSKPNGIGAHQPFVTRANQCIRLYFRNIERESAYGLGSINNEQSIYFTGSLPYGLKVETSAVGPMKMSDSNSSRFFVDRFENSLVPSVAPPFQ